MSDEHTGCLLNIPGCGGGSGSSEYMFQWSEQSQTVYSC